MSKKGLYGYLVSEGLLLCLIEVGKVCGWSVQAVRILMYTAILINTIIVGYCFCHAGTNRTKSSDRLVAYAIFTTAAADFFMTLIGVERGFLPGIILFCFVQIIYALYLRLTIKVLLIRIAFFASGLMALNMAECLACQMRWGSWISRFCWSMRSSHGCRSAQRHLYCSGSGSLCSCAVISPSHSGT